MSLLDLFNKVTGTQTDDPVVSVPPPDTDTTPPPLSPSSGLLDLFKKVSIAAPPAPLLPPQGTDIGDHGITLNQSGYPSWAPPINESTDRNDPDARIPLTSKLEYAREKSSQFDPMADSSATSWAKEKGVDPALLSLLVKAQVARESSGNAHAISKETPEKQGHGLGQFKMSTWIGMGRDPAKIFDPAENIDAMAEYQADNLKKYNGDVVKATAAYNAGNKAVDNAQDPSGVPLGQHYGNTARYARDVSFLMDMISREKSGDGESSDNAPTPSAGLLSLLQKLSPTQGNADIAKSAPAAPPLNIPSTAGQHNFDMLPGAGGLASIPSQEKTPEQIAEGKKYEQIGEGYKAARGDWVGFSPAAAIIGTPERYGRNLAPKSPDTFSNNLKEDWATVGDVMKGLGQDVMQPIAAGLLGQSETENLGRRVAEAQNSATQSYLHDQFTNLDDKGQKKILASAKMHGEAGKKLSPLEQAAIAADPSFGSQVAEFLATAISHPLGTTKAIAKGLISNEGISSLVETLPSMLLGGEGFEEATGVVLKTMKDAAHAYKIGKISKVGADLVAKGAEEAATATQASADAAKAADVIHVTPEGVTIPAAEAVAPEAGQATQATTEAIAKNAEDLNAAKTAFAKSVVTKPTFIRRLAGNAAQDAAFNIGLQSAESASEGKPAFSGEAVGQGALLGGLFALKGSVIGHIADPKMAPKVFDEAGKIADLSRANEIESVQQVVPVLAEFAKNDYFKNSKWSVDPTAQPEFMSKADLAKAGYPHEKPGLKFKTGKTNADGTFSLDGPLIGAETVVEEGVHSLQNIIKKGADLEAASTDKAAPTPYTDLQGKITAWEDAVRTQAKDRGIDIPQGKETFGQAMTAYLGYADKYDPVVSNLIIPDELVQDFGRVSNLNLEKISGSAPKVETSPQNITASGPLSEKAMAPEPPAQPGPPATVNTTTAGGGAGTISTAPSMSTEETKTNIQTPITGEAENTTKAAEDQPLFQLKSAEDLSPEQVDVLKKRGMSDKDIAAFASSFKNKGEENIAAPEGALGAGHVPKGSVNFGGEKIGQTQSEIRKEDLGNLQDKIMPPEEAAVLKNAREQVQHHWELDEKARGYLEKNTLEDWLKETADERPLSAAQSKAYLVVVKSLKDYSTDKMVDFNRLKTEGADPQAVNEAHRNAFDSQLLYEIHLRNYDRDGTAGGRAQSIRNEFQKSGIYEPADIAIQRALKVLPEITAEDAAKFSQLFKTSPAEADSFLSELLPSKKLNKFLEAWRAGMLSSMKTQERNFLGNGSWHLLRLLAKSGRAVVEPTLEKATSGKFKATMYPADVIAEAQGNLEGLLPATKTLLANLYSIGKLNAPERHIDINPEIGREPGHIGRGPRTWYRPAEKLGGKGIRTIFHLLEALDVFHKDVMAPGSLRAGAVKLARKEGFSGKKLFDRADEIVNDFRNNDVKTNNKTYPELVAAARANPKKYPNIVKNTEEEKLIGTFQDTPHAWTKAIVNTKNKFPLLNFLAPFVPIPAKLGERTYQLTPANLVAAPFLKGGIIKSSRALSAAVKEVADVAEKTKVNAEMAAKERGISPTEAAKIGQDAADKIQKRNEDRLDAMRDRHHELISYAVLGTALSGITSAMYLHGKITGSSEKDPDKRQCFVVTINGVQHYLPYRGLGPFTSALTFGPDAMEAMKSGNVIVGATHMLQAVGSMVISSQWYSTLSDFIQAVGKDDNAVVKFASGLVGSVVPAIAGDLAKMQNSQKWETRPAGNPLATIPRRAANIIQSKIPFAGENGIPFIPGMERPLLPKTDGNGNPEVFPGNALSRGFNAFPVSEGDALSEEEAKLGYHRTPVGPALKGKQLNPMQVERINRQQRMNADRAQKMLSSPYYQRLPDKVKKARLKQIMNIGMPAVKGSVERQMKSEGD